MREISAKRRSANCYPVFFQKNGFIKTKNVYPVSQGVLSQELHLCFQLLVEFARNLTSQGCLLFHTVTDGFPVFEKTNERTKTGGGLFFLGWDGFTISRNIRKDDFFVKTSCIRKSWVINWKKLACVHFDNHLVSLQFPVSK